MKVGLMCTSLQNKLSRRKNNKKVQLSQLVFTGPVSKVYLAENETYLDRSMDDLISNISSDLSKSQGLVSNSSKTW